MQDLDELGETVDACLGRWELPAVGLVLVYLPAGTDAEHEPAAAHHIDGRRLVGQEGGMVDGARGNERAQL